MRYFYTCGHYFDCPTCDSVAYDSDSFTISSTFENKYELIHDIQKNIPQMFFYDIYGTFDEGEIKSLTPNFKNKAYGHRLIKVEFELEGFSYSFDGYGKLQHTTDEGYKRLYQDE